MEPDLKKLKEAHGDVIELVTPSKYKVIIRQQTGEDDDVVSDPSGSFMGESLNKFVQGIIIKHGLCDNKAPSYQDIEDMKLCDKYFVIIASRIFSLSNILRFEYEWPDGITAEYEENLEDFIWDYSLEEFPHKGDKGYNSKRIPPHKHQGTGMEFDIGKKKFKFTFINGVGEKYLMTLPMKDLSKNAELKARDLHMEIGEKWVKVDNFKALSAREMVEIRKTVFDNDPVMDIATDIPHPKSGETLSFGILTTPDFLFPREI